MSAPSSNNSAPRKRLVTDDQQRKATDPLASVWVSANAGSGKTHALTTRVARLLLSGTAPERILCLTFTKAAAAEMSSRLYKRLGGWAMEEDAELAAIIEDMDGRAPDTAKLATARKLFARAIETPGGLKIQTIHAFCESVLGRFPLEADVPPHFDILDERSAAELMEEVRDQVLFTAQEDEDGPVGRALAHIVGRVDEFMFSRLMMEIAGRRDGIAALLENFGGVEGVMQTVRLALGVSAEETVEAARAGLSMVPEEELRAAADALDTGSKTDKERAETLYWYLEDRARRSERLDDYVGIFLTAKGEPRKTLMTKKVAEEYPASAGLLLQEQQRILAGMNHLRAVGVAQSTEAIFVIATEMLKAYENAKRARALLDYGDLIEKTRDLLTRGHMGAWVLYKLDGGIDHILVDEAQDTSPEQWKIVQALADEFFTGESAHEGVRTVFAVGDEKQSIFSFQGADPVAFAEMRRHFERAVKAAEMVWHRIPFVRSFRSVPQVLAAVDAVFAQTQAKAGLTADEEDVVEHIAAREFDAGRVEIWPLEEPDETDEVDVWDAPLDYLNETAPPAKLAARIAGKIAGWLESGEMLTARARPIRPGDILILVRRRNAFVNEMIRHLKDRGVPVAGADRMVLMEQMAVMDLVALARFVLLPQDDLNLAAVLKSPFIGLTEDELFELAWGRKGDLWSALQAAAHEGECYAKAHDLLMRLLARADYEPPYEFFAHVLAGEEGRKRLLARLGEDANDPIDEFLALALEYERTHAPSLEGFLHWVERGASEIKRDMDQGRDEVRVMTVHGAKGLEAEIVFMPDTCSMPGGQHDPALIELPTEPKLLLWPVRKGDEDEVTGGARERWREEQEKEYRRLLYVAMTRARDRLYICGYRGLREPPAGCWYNLASAALLPDATEIEEKEGHVVWRIEGEQRRAPEPEHVAEREEHGEPGAWAFEPAPREPAPSRPLTPSRLPPEGLEEPPVSSPLTGDMEARFQRGRLIHRLLQTLPDLAAAERDAAAGRFLSAPAHGLTAEAQDEIAASVKRVLAHEKFADVFAPGGRAEVPVVGQIDFGGKPHLVSGQIDRLCVTDDDVLVIDYKTNRPPPRKVEEASPAYIAQMAAYRALLQRIHPERNIRCALLWTETPDLMELPPELMDEALSRGAPSP